jgi:hypothetical protein
MPRLSYTWRRYIIYLHRYVYLRGPKLLPLVITGRVSRLSHTWRWYIVYLHHSHLKFKKKNPKNSEKCWSSIYPLFIIDDQNFSKFFLFFFIFETSSDCAYTCMFTNMANAGNSHIRSEYNVLRWICHDYLHSRNGMGRDVPIPTPDIFRFWTWQIQVESSMRIGTGTAREFEYGYLVVFSTIRKQK